MYSLKTSAQGYYESLDGITFYTITVAHSPSGRSWILNRKLEEFHLLYDCLSQKFKNLPEPPGYRTLSYLSLFFQSVIPSLDSFLISVLSTSSIYTTEEVYTFFDVGLHVREGSSVKVRLEEEYKSEYVVKSIQADPKLLVTAEVDYATLHRLESYLQIIGYSGSTMSRIRCFSSFGMKEFGTVEAVTVFSFNPEKSTLVLAFESGNLQLLQLKLSENNFEFQELRKIFAHTSPVTGIVIEDSFIYSCSQNGVLIVTSITDAQKFVEITLGFLPKAMAMTENMNYLYFCDQRKVFIFDVNSYKTVQEFSTEVGSDVSAFCVSGKGFVVVAGVNGTLALFSSQCELIRKIEIICAVTALSFNEKLGFVAIADANGIVHLCNNSGDFLFRWKTHDFNTAVCFNGEVCITSGNDLRIRVWKLAGLGFN